MCTSTKLRLLAAVCFGIAASWIYIIVANAQAVATPPIVAMACSYNTTAPAGTDKTFQLVQCSPTGGFVAAPIRGTGTDASGTVASTGVYQTVFTANTSRNSCVIQNRDSNNMTIRVNSTTLFDITPGQAFNCGGNGTVNTALIEITGTATGVFSASYM